MSIFNQISHAFHPVQQVVHDAGHTFDPNQISHLIEQGVRQVVNEAAKRAKDKLPGHLSLHESVEYIRLSEPSFIDIDLFAGFGVDVGIELNLEFGMGATFGKPVELIEGIVDIVEHPPVTVHQLCDKLWTVVPKEIRVYEKLQAVVGEQGSVKWDGDDVMERVVKYIGKRGWLEKKLRP